MSSVALIGPDGAGKTSLARMLLESSPLALTSIYMGINIEASNYALPTSRFVEYLRRRLPDNAESTKTNGQLLHVRKYGFSATLRASARLANRLAEEWYRQLLSWSYQTLGYIVLYDRHFLFDFSLDGVGACGQSFDERLHRWFLTHLYPRPDLVIYLDAPAEVLFRRKGEKTIEELERRRLAFLQQKRQYSQFVVIDATQPLPKVHADVSNCILQSFGKPFHNHSKAPRRKNAIF